MRVYLFFYSFCECWGRGAKVTVSVSHVDFFLHVQCEGLADPTTKLCWGQGI